ncbi:Gfo/Idh/MocA family oxidoreductase [Candidatus Poribacteria bacterium]|nr:Gfo/Idh/MocA family oxidoreductase [Candidatus Poribacteria bacterium]
MADRYRLGVIGVGGMGIANYHAATFVRTERVDLVACCDINEAALGPFQERFRVPAVFIDARSMLEASKLDLVAVCTNETAHAEMTVLSASYAPKAIFCEKPMAMSLDQADGMLHACAAHGTRLFVGHQRRFNSQYARAYELLQEGAVGELESIEAAGHPGGSLLVDGTHTVDLIRFFADEPPVKWVFGQVEATTRRFGWGHTLEDAAMAIICFEGGMRATLAIGGYHTLAKEGLLPCESQAYHRIRLRGSSGTIEINGDGQVGDRPLLRVKRGSEWEPIEIEQGWYKGVSPHAAALDALEADEPHLLDATSARATLEVLLSIYESARTNRLIEMPLANRANPFDQWLAERDAAAG